MSGVQTNTGKASALALAHDVRLGNDAGSRRRELSLNEREPVHHVKQR